MKKDSTKQIVATILPGNAENKKVFWISSNPSVASVDNKGLIRANAAGNATITAVTMDGIKKASVITYVNWDNVTSIGDFNTRRAVSNMFPNPAGQSVFCQFNDVSGTVFTIDFYNMSGSKIKSRHLKSFSGGKTEISLVDLSAGVYLVKFTSEVASESKILIVK